jgi:23S rRNA (adenine2030-N6)-methyltransferase
MLSYQHAYHAGNLADVHKHAVLATMLAYLTNKDKPLTYLETHAGRGLYFLDSPEAEKTGEAALGIDLALQQKWFAANHPYARVLAKVRAQHGPLAYPGSPMIAACLLRVDDRAQLAELHPQEFVALCDAMVPFNAHCRQMDGAAMALAVTPPEPRRGLMLIDPSYEVKADYEAMAKRMYDIHRKWNVGTIALWYPVLADLRHRPMLAAIEGVNFPKTLRHEVRFPPARPGHGMIGSGLFIVNAPYGLSDETIRLDRFFSRLGNTRRRV